jgi:hypothetical protein
VANVVKRLRCDALSVGDEDHPQFAQRVFADSAVCEVPANFIIEGFRTALLRISDLEGHQVHAGRELPEIDAGAIHVNQIEIYHPAKAWADEIQEVV